MANATKKTATKTAAKKSTAAKPAKPASKPAPKLQAGENAATQAIAEVERTGKTGPEVKADAVKAAALAAAEGLGEERRVLVAEGHSITKGGVRYMAGEYVDLPEIDVERFRGVQIVDPDADTDLEEDGDDDGDDGDDTLTGAHGTVVAHPDTEEGKRQQLADEAESARKEAEQLAAGLPSGAENK